MADLSLRDYQPRQRLVVPEHHPAAAAFPAVDAHTHPGRWLSGWTGEPGRWLVPDVDEWLRVAAGYNVRAFVNLDGRWGDELVANLDRFDRAHQGRFATFCQLDWSLLAGPNPGGALVDQLTRSAAAGAAGIKIWKDLGLGARDAGGALVIADDPRLDELWDAAADLGLPIWWHTADPLTFFDPVDQHNENYELLVDRPDFSFHGGDYPSFDRLIDALEAVVAAHPATTFVAVHAGGYAENLSWVGRMLSTYPNLHIDIAARLAQLGRQPRATRDLILRHPDRVLFGADEIPPSGESYPTHFRFLETADEAFRHSTEEPPLMGRWTISGLDLPPDVLQQVYAGNALRLLPQLTVHDPATASTETRP